MINDLLKEVKIEAEQSSTEVQKENAISDKTFVITGDLRQFENRSALKFNRGTWRKSYKHCNVKDGLFNQR